jgi:hypothetical protein
MRFKASSVPFYAILLIVVIFFYSCASESCLEDTTSYVNAAFYKTGTNKPYAPDSITIYGLGNESSKLYNKAINVLSVKLPLNASAVSCGFVMKVNNITDTIHFKYSNYPHLISKECGIGYYFTLDSCKMTGNVVDTVIIRNKNITTFNDENIRIYF